jgi:hypothetical protein
LLSGGTCRIEGKRSWRGVVHFLFFLSVVDWRFFKCEVLLLLTLRVGRYGS